MIWISWPKTSWNSYGQHVLASILPCHFIPIPHPLLYLSQIAFSVLHLLGPLECSLSVKGHRLLATVSPILSRHEKNKKTRIFSYQTDRPGRTDNHTFISLTCFRDFRKTFVFYSFSKILPGSQQCYTFTFRIRALILTGSCDRLPTAVWVTHCRPDRIFNAQQLTTADSAAEGACFSPSTFKIGLLKAAGCCPGRGLTQLCRSSAGITW